MTTPAPTGTGTFKPADTVAQGLQNRLARLRERGAAVETVLSNPVFAGGESQLLIEAARALKNGMTSTGRDQQEEFKDSLGLFREAQAGAIGSRNYVVWFQIGWILWKGGAARIEAEEAFYQAYRLSAATQDIFYYSSQRHRAYLQFLQNKPDDANETIVRAVSLYPNDPDVLRDAARYAVATGDVSGGTAFLQKLLAAEPGQAETIFADDVFVAALPALADVVWQVFESGKRDATAAVSALSTAQSRIADAAERSGVPIALAPELVTAVADAQTVLNRSASALSYPVAQGVVQTAAAKERAMYDFARQSLETAQVETEQRLVRPRLQKERLLFEQKKWKEDVSKLERAARQSKVDLGSQPKRTLFGRYNPEHASLYENYQTARGQAELTAKRIDDEVPVHEADIARCEAEQSKITETIAWLAGA